MTGMLHDLLHERADQVEAPFVDLDEITRTGERRVRRRRTALVGGLAAAVLTASAGGSLLLGDHPRADDGRVADSTGDTTPPLSWVTGSTLHRTDRPDVDLGTTVRAWVQQGDTIVFTDGERRVHVWSDGANTVVGRTVRPAEDTAELVADVSDVAWVDVERGLTRYDVSNGTIAWVPVAPAGGTPRVTALDAGLVYAVDGRGVIAWNTGEGVPRVVSPDRTHVVVDAEHGTTVQRQGGGDRTALVARPGSTRALGLTVADFADLSPSGDLVITESGDESTNAVTNTATGERTYLETGHDWAQPYQWLDDETVAVLAFDGALDAEERDLKGYLLRCSVRDGSCEAQAQSMPGGPGSYQLPIGVHFTE